MSPNLETAIEEFIDYLRDVRRLSAHTAAGYRRDLLQLNAHCEQRGHTRVSEVHETDIRQWAATLHREGKAPASIQRALSAARSLFRYLTSRGFIQGNPAAAVRAPKRGRRLPKSLEPDALGAMLDAASDDPLELRDLAIAELIYSAGLRLQELVDINIGDIDIQQQLVTVTGKGCKTRTVPVGRAALSALERWLAVKPGGVATDPEQAVFTSRQGRRISPRSVQSRLARLAATGRLAQPLHPHMLRHAFASHMLESSGDLRAVQELLGHANIGTTQIYTHLDFQHLAKTYDAAHPRAQRRKKP